VAAVKKKRGGRVKYNRVNKNEIKTIQYRVEYRNNIFPWKERERG
jgi:hypothetical protein